MTGVPRLQQLPVPASPAGATALALAPGGAGLRDQAVSAVTPARAIPARAERGTAWGGEEPQAGAERAGQRSAAATSGQVGAQTGRLLTFPRLSALAFMVQVLGQETAATPGQAVLPQTSLTGHRDAVLLGSDSYRRAGGEPEMLPSSATFVRLAV